jgi:phosphatidylethanolamine/phosphatidyl-N-methylethanolamine N-methyltransferase
VVSSLGDSARFLLHFLRDPQATGAIAPSSRHLAARMIEDMGLDRAKAVIEIGPGTGAFTGAIIAAVPRDARVIAVELNATFARGLADKFPKLDVVTGSAEHVGKHLADRGIDAADAILCSLPWAGFPPDLQRRLLKAIVDALRPGARFATFAYLHASGLPPARKFRQLLESSFKTVTRSRAVWRNIPPAMVYRCEK